ncbi:MAG TPA: spore coat protein U domain-containing protein [Ramlibacter sp.]
MTFSWRHGARTILLALLCSTSPAWAVFACSMTAAPTPLVGIYAAGANRDIAGSFTLTCTRNRFTDERRPYVWIGIDQPVAGQSMPRDIGGSTLTYFIYRRNFGQAVWLNTGSETANSNTNGALRERLDFGNSGSALTQSYNFYFRIPLGQNRPAGVYLETPVSVTLRNDSQAGAVLATTNLTARISIQHNCRFSAGETAVSVAYTAFQPTPLVRVIPFELVCTQGTNYTMALDALQGLASPIQIRYSVALSSTGTITGTALAQAYTATLTIPAGQAGRCTTATCTGTSTRTITITY